MANTTSFFNISAEDFAIKTPVPTVDVQVVADIAVMFGGVRDYFAYNSNKKLGDYIAQFGERNAINISNVSIRLNGENVSPNMVVPQPGDVYNLSVSMDEKG